MKSSHVSNDLITLLGLSLPGLTSEHGLQSLHWKYKEIEEVVMPVIQQVKWSFSFLNSDTELGSTVGTVIFQAGLRSYHDKLTQVNQRSVLFP